MAIKITTNNDVNLCKFSGLPNLFLNKIDFSTLMVVSKNLRRVILLIPTTLRGGGAYQNTYIPFRYDPLKLLIQSMKKLFLKSFWFLRPKHFTLIPLNSACKFVFNDASFV